MGRRELLHADCVAPPYGPQGAEPASSEQRAQQQLNPSDPDHRIRPLQPMEHDLQQGDESEYRPADHLQPHQGLLR
jgi:hypothetical protein